MSPIRIVYYTQDAVLTAKYFKAKNGLTLEDKVIHAAGDTVIEYLGHFLYSLAHLINASTDQYGINVMTQKHVSDPAAPTE